MTESLRVYDPALCCSTGVCGPSVDAELARFAADLAWLAEQGVAVERYNLAHQPGAFAVHPAVRERLAKGVEVLPLVMVGGRIAVEGHYPSRDVLAALAGIVLRPERKERESNSEAAVPCCAAPREESCDGPATQSKGCCG